MNRNSEVTSIPFLDLCSLHRDLEPALTKVFQSCLATAGFIGGPMVEEFEQRFAQFCNVEHCIGVGSGTDALRFALIAAGVRPGDAVVTVPNSFIATAEAISQAGARCFFVDVDPVTSNMSPEKLSEFLETACTVEEETGQLRTARGNHLVRAIVPVHLYGQMADMDAIMAIAERHKILVVEDACQAHGAEYLSLSGQGWKRAGSMGRAAAFSFYPGKNLGALGEAGAVTTNDPGIARMIRLLRDHGQAERYYHVVEGFNGRLDAVQAGCLSVKLGSLENWNEMRRSASLRYRELFGNAEGIELPTETPRTRAIYHLYVIRVAQRDNVREHLTKLGVGTGIHYPVPIHLQKAFEHLGYQKGDFPVAETLAAEILSLPMYPTLDFDQQAYVVKQTIASVAQALAPAL